MHIFLVITSFVLKPHSGRTALDFISMDDHISRFVCLHLRYSELKKTNKLCVTTVHASVYYHIYIYAICTVGDCADGIHIRGGRGGVEGGGGGLGGLGTCFLYQTDSQTNVCWCFSAGVLLNLFFARQITLLFMMFKMFLKCAYSERSLALVS